MEAYLDNSATTRCSGRAAELMMRILREDYGNPSSMHQKGLDAERQVGEARRRIARTLKVQEKELLFTSGGTESNNLAILGGTEANKRAGRHVITTAVEHASVYAAMKELEERGFELTILPVDPLGRISIDALREAIRPDTILVSIMHVNNEIGAVEPVGEAGEAIKSRNPAALFHVDAVQSYGKIPVFPGKENIDLLSVSGHKIHGPKGSGFLYVRERTKLRPQLFGGGQERGLRSGTENVPAIAGLGLAAEEAYEGLSEKMDRLYGLKEFFIREVARINGVSVNGVPAGEENVRGTAPHIVSVSVEGVRAEVLLHALEDKGVYVSAGSACSSNRPSVSRTLKGIGLKDALLDSTIRFSFSTETQREELDYALEVLGGLVPMLRRYSRH